MAISKTAMTLTTALTLLTCAGASALADTSSRAPGFGPFDYFEFSEQSGIYELHDTETPFLGSDVEPLGTFEIGKVTVKQETSALFRTKVTNHGDICRRERASLEENERRTAEASCNVRVWAYKADGQVFFFKADRAEVEREGRLRAFPLDATNWDRTITVRQAQDGILGTHVIRAFSIPPSEIRERSELRSAARSNHLYAFCGATEPGEVVSTEARAMAWNAGLILFGATLNPLYIVKVPKRPAEPSAMKIIQKESISMLLIGNSTFTTEYHLTKVAAQ